MRICLRDIQKEKAYSCRAKLLAAYNACYLLEKNREALKLAKSVLKESKARLFGIFPSRFSGG